MPQQIDNLEIQLIANSTKATNALDNFTQALSKLSGVVGSVQNIGGLQDIANGISAIGNAMQSIKGMRGDSLNALTNALNTISNANSAGLNGTAEGIFNLTASLDLFNSGAIGETTEKLGEFSKAIRDFGLSSAEKAITNIPQLTTAISQMVNALSALPEVKRNTIEAIVALSKFAEQGSKVGSAVNSITKSTKSMNQSVKKSTNLFSSLSDFMGKVYSITGAWANIKGIFNSTIGSLWSKTESAMDYIETYNYFRVALDKIEKQFGTTYSNIGEESANSFQKSYLETLKELNRKMTGYDLGNNGELIDTNNVGLGMNPERMMNFQAQIMGITNSVGLLGDESIDTAKGLSMLATDLSSLTNQDLETVMGNLQSGLIGQSRALYKYGIDITSATLAQTALAHGISKSVSEMSQSEKMELRMLAVLEQSQIAWGDQARTINTVANQYRIFKEQVANLGRVLGNLFLPIVQKVLPFVNALTIVLRDLFKTLGFNFYGDNWLSDINKQISGGVGADVEDLSEGLDDASDNAKKLKNSLLGIDELNVLDKKDDSSGNGLGIGGGLGLSADISTAVGEYESIFDKAMQDAENKIQEYVDKIKKKLEPLLEPLGKLKDAVEPFKENVGEGLKWFWDNVLEPMADWTINEAIPEFLELLADDLELLNTIWDKIKPVVDWFWDKIGKFSFNMELESLTDWLKDIKDPLEAFKDLLDDFSWENFKEFLDEASEAIYALQHPFEYLKTKLAQNILFSDEFADSRADQQEKFPYFTLEYWKPKIDNLGEQLKKPLADIIWGEGTAEEIRTNISNWWSNDVMGFFTERNFGLLQARIMGRLYLGWATITNWWKNTAIYKWWNDQVLPWFDKDNWTFDGIKEGLVTAWENAIEGIKTIWNRFADWVNEHLSFTTPAIDFGDKHVEARTFGITIPKFANGGFVEDGLFMANHNELVGSFSNGKTAVANNDQIIAGIRNGVSDANRTEEALLREQNQLLRQLLAKDTSVHIGDREIAKANNRGQKQLGRTLVIS